MRQSRSEDDTSTTMCKSRTQDWCYDDLFVKVTGLGALDMTIHFDFRGTFEWFVAQILYSHPWKEPRKHAFHRLLRLSKIFDWESYICTMHAPQAKILDRRNKQFAVSSLAGSSFQRRWKDRRGASLGNVVSHMARVSHSDSYLRLLLCTCFSSHTWHITANNVL